MKIFFASAEEINSFYKTLMLLEKPNLLVSYYYLKKWNNRKTPIELFLTQAKALSGQLFLDSGAHTFLVKDDMKKTSVHHKHKKTDDPHIYMENYYKWVAKYGHYFDFIAELDVAACPGVGYPTVQKWRKDLEGLGFKDKLMVVSHYKYFSSIFPNWEDEWRRLLTEYPCVAIGDDPPQAILDRHFAIWKEMGLNNKVHGFAETKIWKLSRYPYYSVDSTSWHLGARFGAIFTYERDPKRGMALKSFRVDRGIGGGSKSYHKFITKVYPRLEPGAKKYTIQQMWDYTEGSYFRNVQNALAFQRLEADLTKIWALRGVSWPL